MAVKNSSTLDRKIGLTTEGIIALKNVIKIEPHYKGYIDLILSVEYSKEQAKLNIEKYKVNENIAREFEIVKAKNDAELRYLEIKGRYIDIYQTIASYFLFYNPLRKKTILYDESYMQSDLWKYGISGDLPIITVTIKYQNDIYVIKQVLKMYEYFRTKNLKIELVIIDEENHSYENYIRNEIEEAIISSQLAYMKNIYSGIFVLSKSEMDVKDVNLIKYISCIVIDSHLGSLESIVKDMEEEVLDSYKISEMFEMNKLLDDNSNEIDMLEVTENLKYYNEYGAFSQDGKEYWIKINKENQTPTTWSHILANQKFGTIVTEANGGYTWYKNSRLNRISSWHNSNTVNIPSEAIYIKDEENGRIWSPTAMPVPDNKNYNVVFGYGYAKFIHSSDELIQELEIFVPNDESIKISVLT